MLPCMPLLIRRGHIFAGSLGFHQMYSYRRDFYFQMEPWQGLRRSLQMDYSRKHDTSATLRLQESTLLLS